MGLAARGEVADAEPAPVLSRMTHPGVPTVATSPTATVPFASSIPASRSAGRGSGSFASPGVRSGAWRRSGTSSSARMIAASSPSIAMPPTPVDSEDSPPSLGTHDFGGTESLVKGSDAIRSTGICDLLPWESSGAGCFDPIPFLGATGQAAGGSGTCSAAPGVAAPSVLQ